MPIVDSRSWLLQFCRLVSATRRARGCGRLLVSKLTVSRRERAVHDDEKATVDDGHRDVREAAESGEVEKRPDGADDATYDADGDDEQ